MIPLRAQIKIKRIPWVTALLLLSNVGIFIGLYHQGFYASSSPHEWLEQYALIPKNLFDPHQWKTLVTYSFLHGGVLHLLGNALMLWVFGPGIEQRMGSIRFAIFYLLCGILSGLGHSIFVGMDSSIPCVGASGSISGVLGAFLFLYPKAKVLTAIPIFILVRFVHIPAFLFIIFWAAMQFFLLTQSANGIGQEIAVMAHVVGFVAGILLFRGFLRSAPVQRSRSRAK